MKRFLAPFLLFLMMFGSLSSAYGHGIGADKSLPVTIGGRSVQVEALLSPNDIKSIGSTPPTLIIRTFDAGNNSTILGIDYRVEIEKDGQKMLDQEFRASRGIIFAKLVPDGNLTTPALINGKLNPGRVDAGSNNIDKNAPSPSLEIKSKIMADGGLYKISVTLQKSSTGLNLEGKDQQFDLYVSVSRTHDFTITSAKGNQTIISVKTFYADVSNLDYDRGSNSVSFSMPFDWNSAYVSQVPVVHAELQIPKTLKEFQVNGYRGYANGKELPITAVLIDDYSFENLRLVHFVLNNDLLTSIPHSSSAGVGEGVERGTIDFVLKTASKPKFPIDLLSTSQKYLWQVAWGPQVIESGTLTTFAMNIQDNKPGGDLVRNSSFDFTITKDGLTLYQQHLTSGEGIFSQRYVFPETGTYHIIADKINGEATESSKIDVVVLQGNNTSSAGRQPSSTGGGQQQQSSSSQSQPSAKPSGCLIATAAYGSELTPQVQLLRGFRDNYILKSLSGSAFMDVFNNIYYSFSPQVADYERQQPWLQATVKTALYPLFGILLASERAFSSIGGGEGGAILAGTVASMLIGAVYVSPAATFGAIVSKNKMSLKLLAAAAMGSVGALAATAAALAVGSLQILEITTPVFVVACASTAAIAVAYIVRRSRSGNGSSNSGTKL